jgi:putative acyl-CoA dehydrogenase
MNREPGVLDSFFAEVNRARGMNADFDAFTSELEDEFRNSDNLEYRARNLTDRMALAIQASLLLRGENTTVAEGFCAGRLRHRDHFQFGNLPDDVDCAAIIERATPSVED